MAGGKLTPRQKMINMMYLVLTALLAMNVSSEILNAFKTVNNSIMKSNSMITDKNNGVNEAFNNAMNEPGQAEKAKEWMPFSDQATKVSNDMYNYIEGLKTELKKQSGLEVVDGVETYKEDDLDAATRLFIEEDNSKKGIELYDKMKKYKTDLLASIDYNKLPAPLNEKVKADVDNIAKSLPINMDVPTSKTGNKYSNDAKGWLNSNFHMTPTVAAVTILTKLQNDIKNSEATVKDYCLNQIGKVKFVYDKFEAIVSANTNYTMPGEPIEVYAGVGAFSEQAAPTISINGAVQPLQNGKATYKTIANGVGKHTIPVSITFTKPDGGRETKQTSIEYTVGAPSGAAVMLEKMNVVYIGVDNPMKISSGSGDEKTSVTANGGGLTITKNGGGQYTARATTPTLQAGLKVSVQGGKSFDFPLRVKKIPNPIAYVGGDRERGAGTTVPAGYLKAQSGIVALLDNFDFKCDFKITGFSMLFAANGDIVRAQAAGPRFSESMISAFGRLKSKNVVIFDDIKAVGCDNSTRKLNQIAFTIQ